MNYSLALLPTWNAVEVSSKLCRGVLNSPQCLSGQAAPRFTENIAGVDVPIS